MSVPHYVTIAELLLEAPRGVGGGSAIRIPEPSVIEGVHSSRAAGEVQQDIYRRMAHASMLRALREWSRVHTENITIGDTDGRPNEPIE